MSESLTRAERAILERLVRTGPLSVTQLFSLKTDAVALGSLDERGLIALRGDDYSITSTGRKALK